MKTKLLTAICLLALGSASVTPCYADADKPERVIADVAVLRPAGLFATAVGSVFFVISLPFSAATHSIKDAAHTLVVGPAKATFHRPLGDFSATSDMISSSGN